MVPARTARSRRGAALAGALAVAVLLAGCGTRMSAAEIDAASGLGGRAVTVGTGRPTAAAVSRPVAMGPSHRVADAVPSTAPNPAKAVGVVRAPRSADSGSGVEAGKPTQAAPATVPQARCERALAPVVLGQTAPTSGIIGAATADVRTGLALWARAVNAGGGLACHPVRLYQMDDGADPARVTTNLTSLVKSKGAVAIVAASVPTTFSAARQFAEKNHIPFVGGDLIEPGWFASPYMFPQGGTPFAAYAGAIKEAAAATGGKKVGLLYCVEAGACGEINEHFEAMVHAAGAEFTLRKVTSITAPDYTAECQAMKAAGVQVLFLAMEGASDARVARSCRSLSYQPAVAVGAISVSEAVSDDANLRAMGLYLGTGNAPFTATDTPGGKEFRANLEALAPGSSTDQNSMYAWVSGKLLESAIAAVAKRASTEPITTALILDGLAQIKDETLGGLAPGITFVKGGPPKLSDCYYALAITERGYWAPRGSKVDCLQGLPRGF